MSAGTAQPRASLPDTCRQLPARDDSWTCGTGRPRLTNQRYAEPGSGVKPARLPVVPSRWPHDPPPRPACPWGARRFPFRSPVQNLWIAA